MTAVPAAAAPATDWRDLAALIMHGCLHEPRVAAGAELACLPLCAVRLRHVGAVVDAL